LFHGEGESGSGNILLAKTILPQAPKIKVQKIYLRKDYFLSISNTSSNLKRTVGYGPLEKAEINICTGETQQRSLISRLVDRREANTKRLFLRPES
jgi:hypothetical protein